MISILHTADWQIGRVFAQFEPDDAAALFEARFAVVERLASIATDRGVDAILVAGDVFDAQTVADKTIRRLFNAMQGYTGTWILMPGNHDAALAESVWTRAQRLGTIPGNVMVCLEPKPVVVAGKFTLLPAPLTQRNTYVDLTEWFAAHISADDLPRIGLAHGSVQGVLPEGVDSANPIAAGRAQGAGLAYLALGDWHGTKRVDGKTWYAGTPESDRFKANESGQALLVAIEVPALEPVVTAIATGKFGWRQIEQQMAVDSDVDEVVRTLDAVGGSDVLHVRLTGTCNLAGHRKLSAALGAARAKARAVLWDAADLRLEPTEEDIQALQADGFVGEALQELRDQQAGGEPEMARDALLALARILDDQAPRRGAGA